MCSILVTIQPIERLNEHLVSGETAFSMKGENGQIYLASVAIIDLDPKPFSKMPKFLASEKKVASSYAM